MYFSWFFKGISVWGVPWYTVLAALIAIAVADIRLKNLLFIICDIKTVNLYTFPQLQLYSLAFGTQKHIIDEFCESWPNSRKQALENISHYKNWYIVDM